MGKIEMRCCFIFIIFLIFGLFSHVDSQSDSCSSNFSLSGLVSFETNVLHCNSVWDSQGFILRYLQSKSNVWNFVLSAPNTNSYVAIGFSTNGKMVGSSAMVGWVPPNGSGVIKQYYLGATNPNQVMPDQGSLSIVSNSTTIISQSSRLFLAFQLNITQPQSRLIYSVGPRNRFPLTDNRLSEHRDQISTLLDYNSGESTQQRQHSRLRKSHGILNMLGWGILMFIGAMSARYLRRWDPIWFYSHISIQILGFTLGVSGIIAGLVLEDLLSVQVDRHKTIGIFIIVLGCLQVMAFLARPDKESKVRKYWNWYHHSVGRVLIILAVANVFYGIHLGNEGSGWNAGYGVVLAILVVITIILEIRLWTRK